VLLEKLPQEHLEFLSSLPRKHLRAGFGFVHAGVRPGVPLEDHVEGDMLWIREPFLSSEADFGSVIVHGHTPAPEPEFRRNRIGIDTGAFQSNRLTCPLLLDTGAGTFQLR
jgi:diadenosine tetraphosphatase ApaH/serine/threonine PP2A family protein phosphatase